MSPCCRSSEVAPGEFESPTPGFSDPCSYHLSYSAKSRGQCTSPSCLLWVQHPDPDTCCTSLVTVKWLQTTQGPLPLSLPREVDRILGIQ